MWQTFYLSLGSNLGDRRGNLERAIAMLEAADLKIEQCSSVYETEPRDVIDQPPFLNLVVRGTTCLTPQELLHRTLAVETELGRVRCTTKGPRIIDIDILLFGELAVHSLELTIPHPRMLERRFVLEPLAEIAPQWNHATIRELLDAVRDQRVTRLRA